MKATTRKLLVLLLCGLPLLASAEIAVVTSPDTGVSSLSEREVRQLFNGETRELGGQRVTLLDLPEGDATRDTFYRELMGRTTDQMQSHWARQVFTGGARPPREVASISEMKSRAASPGALGYLPADEVDEDELRVLFRLR